MKKSYVLALLFLVTWCFLLNASKLKFHDYFQDSTLRVDYFHTADKKTDIFALDTIYRQGVWAGNPTSLIDTFNNGQYYLEVFEKENDILIYSKGFNSYCGEYKTTTEAAQGIKRTFHETLLLPYPKKTIRLVLKRRDNKNTLHPVYRQEINPSGPINTEAPTSGVTLTRFLDNGAPGKKVDIAFIAEGYKVDEKKQFKKDAISLIDSLFACEPYASRRKDFNITGVFKPSLDSGPDEPLAGKFKNTAISSSFNALNLPRYLLTRDNQALRDIAAHVPYDTLVILVNSERYGGGGLYNTYCILCSRNTWKNYLLHHEIGHSFAGLADEYYGSPVAYNDFFKAGTEPTEPNITALLDNSKLKWKHLLTKDTPVPTPWNKNAFDKKNRNQKKIHLANHPHKNHVGAFEGAGYLSRGMYRPMINCIMFTRGNSPYCRVCQDAVNRMIDYYSR
ncbi:MAG: peptidase M64 [bacterium]|nr:peptidase M64 [bacterium]